jgi:hypothetical protein
MKVKRWRKKATEREVWAKIVWEVKVLGGLWHIRSVRNSSHDYLFLM